MSQEVALITGASSGLGFACTRHLIMRDISTLMVARNPDVLLNKAEEVEGIRKNCHLYSFASDVNSIEDIQCLKKFIENENLSIKWLINNAGIGKFGELKNYSFQDIEETIRTNLIGIILMSQVFLDQIITNNGVLCNILSTAALTFRQNETIYTASKWGARGFTESLRAECKGKTIRIMGVYPGGMDTPFWEENRHYQPDTSKFLKPEIVAERIISNIFDASGCQVSDITINRL